MAVKLRLTRMGRKKKPFYRIIAVDSRAPRDGRYLENLGTYNPLPDPFEVKIDEERVFYWLSVGAIPTNTVKSLLRREGILFKWDLKKRGLTDEEMDQEMKRWEVIQLERRRKLEKKLEEKAQAKKEAEEQKDTAPEPEEVEVEAEAGAEENVDSATDVQEAEAAASPVEDSDAAEESSKKEVE